jgi:hypothetical protein
MKSLKLLKTACMAQSILIWDYWKIPRFKYVNKVDTNSKYGLEH